MFWPNVFADINQIIAEILGNDQNPHETHFFLTNILSGNAICFGLCENNSKMMEKQRRKMLNRNPPKRWPRYSNELKPGESVGYQSLNTLIPGFCCWQYKF